MAGPRLLATLMSEPSIGRLLVANPFRSTPIQWARKIMGQRPPPFPGDGRYALVEPRRIRRRDPTSVQALERAYAAYDRKLEAAAADLGFNRPVVITTNPLVAGFSPLRWADQVTFYAWDDWPAALALHRWWAAYDEAFARIRELGRAVVGVSQAVVDRIQPTGANAVVPNGVAPEEWLRPDAPPTWFTELPQPRILYAGAMTRERLSIETLSEIAMRFAHGSLVLVGPILDRGMLVPLLRCPNVWVHSEVGRTEVASIIHSADVCIMPHRFNPLTMAMSPSRFTNTLLQAVRWRLRICHRSGSSTRALSMCRRVRVSRTAWKKRYDVGRSMKSSAKPSSTPTPGLDDMKRSLVSPSVQTKAVKTRRHRLGSACLVAKM